MSSIYTKKGSIAIEQPVFKKIEAQIKGGIATIAQRVELIEAKVLLHYSNNDISLNPGDYVILKGDAGLHPWAKQVLNLKDLSFVLVPETEIVGYIKEHERTPRSITR
jgi:hypothetical protein